MTNSAHVRSQVHTDAFPHHTGADWEPTLEDPVIREYIYEAAGEAGMMVAEIVRDNQPILGVDLVEMVDDKPSAARRTLYKLEEARVAEYEKDTDRSGWETFTWRMSLNEVKYLINQRRREQLEHLRARLNFEEVTTFYQCPDDHPRVDFETAMELDFHCPVCEAPMANVDNSAEIAYLKGDIKDLEGVVF